MPQTNFRLDLRGYRNIGTLFRNLDGALDEDVRALVQESATLLGLHTAWDFLGHIVFHDGIWIEEVWQYGEYQKTFQGELLGELIKEVCDEFGYS